MNSMCNLSLCSSRVHFVRGERQYLYDDKGVRYLDTMNSVQLGKAGGGGEGGGGEGRGL